MSKKPLHITAYHGSGNPIDTFSYEWCDQGNDQYGSGFYFTSDLEEAACYTTATSGGMPKLGGADKPTVHIAELTFSNPFKSDYDGQLTARQVKSIILASPVLDEALENWGQVDYEGKQKVINRAVESYARPRDTLLDTLNCLSNDFFPDSIGAFNRAVRDATGFDGVIHDFGNKVHYVVWFPEQIKITDRISKEEALEEPPPKAKRLKP